MKAIAENWKTTFCGAVIVLLMLCRVLKFIDQSTFEIAISGMVGAGFFFAKDSKKSNRNAKANYKSAVHSVSRRKPGAGEPQNGDHANKHAGVAKAKPRR